MNRERLGHVIPNIVAVARREFMVRVRTRSFVFGTILLVAGVVAIAFVPVIIRYFEGDEVQQVLVSVGDTDAPGDPVATLDALLNASAGQDPTGTTRPFAVAPTDDVDGARRAVESGDASGLLALSRDGGGELEFTLYTEGSTTGRLAQVLRQAATAIAIGDRLERLGIDPGQQAGLFAPPSFAVRAVDGGTAGQGDEDAPSADEFGTTYLLGFGMTILIFMMIVLYGNWVAMSVVEEKSSRVMEVILNAATPFQLLTGKVLGVGAVAFVQYLVLLAAGVGALLVQGPVAATVLGEGATSVELPAGLTIGLLVAFGVYGVLGFLLYAVLYAAAGSLVSRQEDVQAAVMPMSIVSVGGYMIAVYGTTGLLDLSGSALTVLSQVPLVSPFMMLGRMVAGEIGAWEIPLSIALLVVAIIAALWVSGRIYAAGVLLYGQRPSLGAVLRIVRKGT